jgi:hypothetical protein
MERANKSQLTLRLCVVHLLRAGHTLTARLLAAVSLHIAGESRSRLRRRLLARKDIEPSQWIATFVIDVHERIGAKTETSECLGHSLTNLLVKAAHVWRSGSPLSRGKRLVGFAFSGGQGGGRRHFGSSFGRSWGLDLEEGTHW